MTEESATVSRRRKLTPERERELLRVTAELVAEVGYDRVTMAAVAQRAKCSTATLYRQWDSKPRLVVTAWKAYEKDRGIDLAQIDTGSLRGDLKAVVRILVADDPAKGAFASVPPAVVQQEGLMELVREILLHPVRSDLAMLLERAVRRGEIAADNPAIGLTDQVLLSPWIAQSVLYGTPATQELMENILDTVLLPALNPQPATV
ncbi:MULTISPECIES: TetR/AcrR family transcriptional regulator [unclassified Streptomyces]|uniref:TetR/AcrR family transcriptional regulator n=1 Tax=unclassified Streptomyces TaxID=2593676 RepID=UPI003659753C